jgi:hypothetical protein
MDIRKGRRTERKKLRQSNWERYKKEFVLCFAERNLRHVVGAVMQVSCGYVTLFGVCFDTFYVYMARLL